MSRKEKALSRIKALPRDYNWNEAVTLMSQLGYRKLEGSGSRVKFYNSEKDCLASLHRPHPNPHMLPYAVKELRDHLKEYGYI